MRRAKMEKISSFVYNIVLLLILGLPILLFDKVVEPTKRGFFPGDESLSYPYHGSTVPSWLLYTVGFGGPCAVIFSFHLTYCGQGMKNVLSGSVPDFIMYLVGAATSQLHTDVCKYTVGRLRPHFFEVCQPLFDEAIGGNNLTKAVYVTNYTCMGNFELFPDDIDRNDRIREVHVSFPSGHSSFSFQAAVFVILYLQIRYAKIKLCMGLNRQFVQIIASLLATFTAVSRIMDYKHHPTDVLAGTVIGILSQLANFWVNQGIFVETKKESDEDSGNTSLVATEENELNSNARRRHPNYNSTTQ